MPLSVGADACILVLEKQVRGGADRPGSGATSMLMESGFRVRKFIEVVWGQDKVEQLEE